MVPFNHSIKNLNRIQEGPQKHIPFNIGEEESIKADIGKDSEEEQTDTRIRTISVNPDP
jgi:hypothetical protein